MKRKHLLGLFAVLTPLAAMGCAAILGLDDPIVDKATAGDAGDGDASGNANDGGTGDGSVSDTGPDVQYSYTYNDITNRANWEVYDLANAGVGPNQYYGGGAFDGKWVYFSPSANAVPAEPVPLVRFHTKRNGVFTDNANWEIYNVRTVDQRSAGFQGAVFATHPQAGNHLFYVPQVDSAGERSGLVIRFDTSATTFGSSSSLTGKPALQKVDLDQLFPEAGAIGYYSGVFDGQKYLYLVPGTGGSHMAARLDVTKDFTQAGSWALFDTLKVAPADITRGYIGGVFDGRYVYFVPYARTFYHGFGIRYDTTKDFADPASWEETDTARVDPGAIGFQGGAFDGRHVYYVPFSDETRFHGRVARYDTAGVFSTKTDASSGWEVLELGDAGLNGDGSVPGLPAGSVFDPRGYSGAAFDGRYVYFVPSYRDTTLPNYHGLVPRYDTLKSFAAPDAWSFFDTTQLAPPDGSAGPGSGGFIGAVFDGSYLYFVPAFGSVTVRFHARNPADNISPPDQPPFGGSFY